MDLIGQLKDVQSAFAADIARAATPEELETARIAVLGRKGKIAALLSELPNIAPRQRPEIGKVANETKEKCLALYSDAKNRIENERESAALASFDATMPGRRFWEGSLHPVTLITREICAVFRSLGYEIASGPEVEIDRFNFEALNMPPDHPARDMQDTLYITDNVLLRTHTSPVQVRSMLAASAPLAVVAPGKVYRRDSDITHTPMFHQVEGLLVDRGVSMADLKGTLLFFIRSVFGQNTKMRFRPSFFPFTEPSAEVDITCALCAGSGRNGHEPCRVCKGSGWVEILGCGMVDPAVFKAVNYSPDLSGFAFGLGVERIAMLKYGINDLRIFFQNNIRFLEQFGWTN